MFEADGYWDSWENLRSFWRERIPGVLHSSLRYMGTLLLVEIWVEKRHGFGIHHSSGIWDEIFTWFMAWPSDVISIPGLFSLSFGHLILFNWGHLSWASSICYIHSWAGKLRWGMGLVISIPGLLSLSVGHLILFNWGHLSWTPSICYIHLWGWGLKKWDGAWVLGHLPLFSKENEGKNTSLARKFLAVSNIIPLSWRHQKFFFLPIILLPLNPGVWSALQ